MACMLFLQSRKNLVKEHLRVLTKGILFYSKVYENILLMGDYNAEITETNMSSFCEIYHLTDIMQPICFKSFKFIMQIFSFETGLSDFHKLIITVLKSPIPKQKPKIIKCRNYKGLMRQNLGVN